MQVPDLVRIVRALFGSLPLVVPVLVVPLAGLAFGLRGILLVAAPLVLLTLAGFKLAIRYSRIPAEPVLSARLATWLVEQGREGTVSDILALSGRFSVSPETLTEALTAVHELALAPFFWDKASGRVDVPRVSASLPHCPQCAADIPPESASGRCKNCRILYVTSCHKKPFYYI